MGRETMKRPGRYPPLSVVGLACVHVLQLLLAGCAAGGVSGGPLTVRGELISRERISVPTEGVAVVELARARDGRVVAEQRLALAGRQVPVSFEVKALRAAFEDGATYFVRGAIAVFGRTRWVSDAVEIRARSGTLEVGSLLLKPYEPAAFSSPLVCGPRSASVGTARVGQRDILQLTVGAERFELYETVTASGARYEAVTDPGTFVWFKGQRATLSVRGETFPECVVAE
jgi:uncharacterized lipoprotein YbaY/membrane-bound inhibitor of C-type lysozyme